MRKNNDQIRCENKKACLFRDFLFLGQVVNFKELGVWKAIKNGLIKAQVYAVLMLHLST